ncbi:MAG: hydantoinase/oxoprolinase family protein [Nitrososphaerales archaeon]
MEKKLFRVGVDIGGTFTDLVALGESGEIINIKVPTTPKNPSIGVLDSFHRFTKGIDVKDIELIVHATTIATNAILGQVELNLPKTALITTYGFKDIVEIGRQRRAELYNLFFQKPKQLIQRKFRFEVRERIDAFGNIIEPLNINDVYSIIDKIKSEGIEAVAICFLNSYVNPIHELRVKEEVIKNLPNLYVCCSSEVTKEYREYERFSTTIVNVMLMPIVSKYLKNLIDGLREFKISAPFFIMQSSGGMASIDYVSKKPTTIIESGPASGVVASAFYSNILGLRDVISFDMGGTTAKAGSIRKGIIESTSEYEVAGRVHKGRIVKGSGYPIRGSFIDLAECSAGGGTMAWVDEIGALRVGPLSAGAYPGPACYGLGGLEPTVTDANLILGRLNPKFLLGGELQIRMDLAKRAIEERICNKTGLSLIEAAAGIIKIANSEMAKIIRIVSVERGYDPRDFTMIAFGGAGPMHACALAEEINLHSVIIPPNPGLFSALGLVVSDFKYEVIKSIMKNVSFEIVNEVEQVFNDLEIEGLNMMPKFFKGDIIVQRYLDMRYVGQSYELIIPIAKPLTNESLMKLIDDFHNKHEETYGYSAREGDVEIVNARVVIIGIVKKPRLKVIEKGEAQYSIDSVIGEREVFFEESNQYINCKVFNREKLKSGNIIDGPAIIEQYDSTIVVYPNWLAEIDNYGNVIMRWKK